MSRATLTDVARRAGVSISTASLAFSGRGPISPATRQRVLTAAAELEYRGPDPMAASLRRGHSNVVAVLVPRTLKYTFRDPVSLQILDGITETLSQDGYAMLLRPLAPDDPTHPPVAIDAAITLCGWPPDQPNVQALQKRQIPVVLQGGGRGGTLPYYCPQDREGMRALGEYLLSQGHTRISLATLPWQPEPRRGWVNPATAAPATIAPTSQRLLGLRDAGVEPVGVWECSGSLVEEGMTAARELLAGEPQAIVGFSDLIAAGVWLAVRELSTPVAVAGFDGVDLPWLGEDRLTTVVQPFVEQGLASARAAVALAQGKVPEPSVAYPVQLRVGTTTR